MRARSWGSGESHQIGIMDNVDQFTPKRAAVLGDLKSQTAQTQCIDVWLQINKACPCCNRKIDDITPVLVDGAVVPPA